VRAVWDEENAKWWFSVLDIVAMLTDQNDYTKTRNYWKYLKAKLKKENSQVVSATTQLKFSMLPDKKLKQLLKKFMHQAIILLFGTGKMNREIRLKAGSIFSGFRMELSGCLTL
jgi:cell filamentation protein